MTKYTFNKDDWSGEEITIDFKEDGTFEFGGDNFAITKETSSKAASPANIYTFETVKVFRASDEDRSRPIATAIKTTAVGEHAKWSDKAYLAYEGELREGALNRSDVVAEVALTKVLSNIIKKDATVN